MLINGGWIFCKADNDVARMYGYKEAELKRIVGDKLVPIHYDMCVAVSLIQAFLDKKDQMQGLDELTVDFFHDVEKQEAIDFVQVDPVVKTVKEFLALRNL